MYSVLSGPSQTNWILHYIKDYLYLSPCNGMTRHNIKTFFLVIYMRLRWIVTTHILHTVRDKLFNNVHKYSQLTTGSTSDSGFKLRYI